MVSPSFYTRQFNTVSLRENDSLSSISGLLIDHLLEKEVDVAVVSTAANYQFQAYLTLTSWTSDLYPRTVHPRISAVLRLSA
jgi:hypothetical protein